MLEIHKVFRNIDTKDLLFGFEIIDLFFIFFIFNLGNIFDCGFIINLTVCLLFAATLRLLKLNKPRGYLLDLIRFFTRKHRWSNGGK
ncbi:MAG: hypothetical protein Q8P84_09555 [Deltaproteobacteria bacterium]|nr:hypothetical protein [Deltaproteobacteria bacterium]MDZ4224991.1 hypothetical protein [bacterium]